MTPPQPAHAAGRRAGIAAIAAILAAWVLAGCQTLGPLTSSIPAQGELPTPVPRTWPDARQDVIAQQANTAGLARMPQLEAYLNNLLGRIKTAAGVPDWPGQVYLLAAQPLNAHATAAGNVYLSWSWIQLAESEDEIVALLAHEYAHVVLHHHGLSDKVSTSNQVSSAASKVLQSIHEKDRRVGKNEWSKVDSINTAYLVGRDLIAPAWARAQEIDADLWSMNIGIRLGYSSEGNKGMLERILSAEQQQQEKDQKLVQEINTELQLRKQRNIQVSRAAARVVNNAALPGQLTELASTLLEDSAILLADVISQQLQRTLDRMRVTHPDTQDRFDRITSLIQDLPDEVQAREPTTAPLRQARSAPAAARFLKQYTLAYEVLDNPEGATALRKARLATSLNARHHAIPLKALSAAQMARATNNQDRRRAAATLGRSAADASNIAWFSVREQSRLLLEAGQRQTARKVMDHGFLFFHDVGNVWPQAISFYSSVDQRHASTLAQECTRRFSIYATACAEAALRPSERTRHAAQTDAKEKSLVVLILEKMQ